MILLDEWGAFYGVFVKKMQVEKFLNLLTLSSPMLRMKLLLWLMLILMLIDVRIIIVL